MKKRMIALLVLSGSCLVFTLNCIPNVGRLFGGINLPDLFNLPGS